MRNVLLAVCLLRAAAAVAAPTLLEVERNGLVEITFPDGTRADMYPAVEGLRWAYSDCRHGQPVRGIAADLCGAGLTVAIPVRGPQPGTLQVFGRLTPDPADAHALRFTYRFSAASPTRLNCARLTFRLPTREYAEQSLASVEGPQTAPGLPAEPLTGGHLLNATAGGVTIAEGQPRGLRIELDSLRWCIVDDSRRWTRDDEFSIQLCAVVASEGTTLTPDDPVEVSGTIRFASEVEVRVAESQAPQPVDLHVAQADVSNPWFPRLLNDAGETLLTVDLGQIGQPDYMHPEPVPAAELPAGAPADPQADGPAGQQADRSAGRQAEPQPAPALRATVPAAAPATAPAAPSGAPLPATARLYADARRQAYLDLSRTLTTGPGWLRLTDVLTAHGDLPSDGVVAHFTLAGEYAASGSAVATYLNESLRQTVLGDPADNDTGSWETAHGLRLQTPEGKTLVELRSDVPRAWISWPGYRVVTLLERLLEPDGRLIPDGTVCEQTLTLRWPAKR